MLDAVEANRTESKAVAIPPITVRGEHGAFRDQQADADGGEQDGGRLPLAVVNKLFQHFAHTCVDAAGADRRPRLPDVVSFPDDDLTGSRPAADDAANRAEGPQCACSQRHIRVHVRERAARVGFPGPDVQFVEWAEAVAIGAPLKLNSWPSSEAGPLDAIYSTATSSILPSGIGSYMTACGL